MEIINSILNWVMKKRIHDIDLFLKYPIEVQNEIFAQLVKTARKTKFGREHGFEDIKSIRDYKNQVPVYTYENLFPYIEKLLNGEQNVLWPSEIKWFAKSSGTTNAKSKFIPVSQEALTDCHFKGGKDMLSIYFNNHPNSKMFTGKGLAIGGSQQINQFDSNSNSYYGDVSAVIMSNLPFWAELARTPKLEIALMSEWEEKIEKMATTTIKENVTNIVGVPTWTVVLIQRILEITNTKNIHEVWPNLEVFIHGAVSFEPYRKLFKKLAPSPKMGYLETYNASEGFFGIQDQPDSSDLLLMLDYGIFYEFIPLENVDEQNPETIGLEDVELNKNYALIISTNAGLWRYMIGDTIKFTCLNPFRIRISGRTKHFINAFGEELIIENAEHAIKKSCEVTHASIGDYTAGPRYIGSESKGSHEWIIEFNELPNDKDQFVKMLDKSLMEVNSDYEAKRYKSMALEAPVVHFAPEGTFHRWLKSKGKLGGQHKVPRLSNSREILEDILPLLK
ncbi:MAG: GH3 auxin-responsive promoter family protein [Cyclobacteriaceae bacterium]|nr:GH3 auxin-responsive promoter family protein [Cyclobacteriaceae bacterium]